MNENIYCLITYGIDANKKTYHNRQNTVSGSIAFI